MKHRYRIEVADGHYDVDDYLIRAFGVECFSTEFEDGEAVPDNFVIYQPVTAIHDFEPKISSLVAFQKMKKTELQKAHDDWKKAEEQQREQLNKITPQTDVDVI